MTWYSAGTITLTNGSTQVIAAGARFVANVSIGDALIPNGGNPMQIANVVSDTELTLARPWLGATAGGVTYDVQPTQSYERDLALAAAAILNTFAAVRDGVGQGMFGDGTAAAPGIRFASDQDTGLRRYAENGVTVTTGGVDRVVFNSSGWMGVGGAPGYFFDVLSPGGPYVGRMINTNGGSDQYAVVLFGQAEGGAATGYVGTGGSAAQNPAFRGTFVVGTQNAKPLVFATGDREKARIDADGNLLVGMTSGSDHAITKNVAQGSIVLRVSGPNAPSLVAVAVNGYNPNAAGAALYAGQNTATGRSFNAAGTVNASGADYAEYMLKAAGCGLIAKGDICGVDRDGKLTKTWADAISFVVKSTDPSLVGGDTWAAHLAPRPVDPGAEPVEPTAPVYPADPSDEATVSLYRAAAQAYPALIAAYKVDHAEWKSAADQFATDLAAWEAELETARQCVDRIAFCGQVPCNVTGNFEVGDYIIAAASGAGIKAIAVKPDDITLAQYMRRIGKVWAIRDGRAWIDVQHG